MAANWKQVDQLIDEQKLKEAERAVMKIYDQSKQKAPKDWAQSLIMLTKIRIGLHSYETAVKELKAADWPKTAPERTLVELYYAQALFSYLQEYSWEIRQRERTVTLETVDLKAWTAEQIYEHALQSFGNIWTQRSKIEDLAIDTYKDIVQPNNFPKKIRSTLRDLITYKAVEALQNTSFWRAEDSAQIYRLDLEKILARNSGITEKTAFKNASNHPILLITYLLNDLSDWHQKNDRSEAALEAGLTFYSTMHLLFTESNDRKKVRAKLGSYISESPKSPWVARALGELADIHQQVNELNEAHKIVSACVRDFVAQDAKKCAYIIQLIERPELRLTSMRSDGLGKRSVLVEHKNLKNVYFRAYKTDIESFLSNSTEQIVPSMTQHQEYLKKNPDLEWKLTLPKTSDYINHRTFVVPPLKEIGFYIIMASAHEGFRREDNVIESTSLNITDLVTVIESDNSKHSIKVVYGQTGLPVKDADVKLYRFEYGKKHQLKARKKTDANGEINYKSDPRSSFFVVAQKAEDISIDESSIYYYGEQKAQKRDETIIYTDRQVYRPKQKIKWKIIAYNSTNGQGDFRILAKKSIEVYLRDANHEQVAKTTVVTNDFGSAAGEFDIPEGSLLGNWQIATNNGHNGRWINIEEYKRPTFEIDFPELNADIELNKKAKVIAKATYLFGSPVSEGKAVFRITRSTIQPRFFSYLYINRNSKSILVAHGEAALNKDGSFDIEFTPEAKSAETAAERATRYSYEVAVDVTDSGGETRSETKRLIAGYATLSVTMDRKKIVCTDEENCTVNALLTNLNGIPQEGKGEIKVIKLVPPEKTIPFSELPVAPDDSESDSEVFKTEGDRLRPRWERNYTLLSYLSYWPEGAPHSTKAVKHDKTGLTEVSLGKLPLGAYKIVYSSQDRNGNEFSESINIVSIAANSELNIPLLLEFAKDEQSVGGTVQLYAHTGFNAKGATVSLFHSGKIIKKVSLAAGTNIINLPITPDMRGGISAKIDLIHDFQVYSAKDTLFVPWDNKSIKVSFSTLRGQLTPGTEETLTVKVEGANAKDRAAEILTFMYDKSLDLFGQYNVTGPISLFPKTFSTPAAQINLIARSAGQIGSAGFSTKADFPFYSTDQLISTDNYSTGGAGLRMKSRAYNLSEGAVSEPAPAPASAPTLGVRGLSSESAPDEAAAASTTESQSRTDSPSLRENFNETAFFIPHLVTDANGSASMTFKLPDSLTTWHVWALATMKDFSSGVAHREVQTTKDLMVRLYTPRLFREGDRTAVQVVVNNKTKKTISGSIAVLITDENNKNVGSLFGFKELNSNFSVDSQGSSATTVELRIPPGLGSIKLSAVATSGNISDGEVRTVPILPGRMHLVQSRFTALKDNQKKTVEFKQLKDNKDTTLINEKLTVTVDGQLFFSTLKALPYLVEYPYECTEQTLNRFLSAGIMAALFAKNPNLAKAASEFSTRKSKYEPWVDNDPNSRMRLEESPWLQTAAGGQKNEDEVLINLLKNETAVKMRSAAFTKLRKYQTANGGFPWFPGGEPSPYITLYLLHGLAKAEEFSIPVPNDVIAKAWSYLGQQKDRLWIKPSKDDLEYLTFFLYTASSFKDQSTISSVVSTKDREKLLSFSFKNWKNQSPYAKLMLSLTLHRAKRTNDANLVLESVLDSAITDESTGTHWSAEERSWLWYNDTIETHAFALRVLTEMRPKDSMTSGLVQWLFMNKKLNQWKSTKATAEVIYSLAKWMGNNGTLLQKEEVSVEIGKTKHDLLFREDKYEGRKFIQMESTSITPEMSNISVQKKTGGLMFASAAWHYSTEKLPETSSGDFFNISRSYFKRQAKDGEIILEPIKPGQAVRVGDEIEVQISIKTKHQAEYVHLRDPRPAGFQPVSVNSGHRWEFGLNWYEEIRDNGTNFFFEQVPIGEYTFRYRMRAANAGTFRSIPAEIQSMYAPEFNGFSSGTTLEVVL